MLINIIGGVCLLLWGLRSVRNSVTRAFGANLHKVISAGTGTRIGAFTSGIGVTTVLQSSTATSLIVATFSGRGLITVSAALAVMLGADVGTTLIAQVLSFDLSWIAPLLMITGYVLFSKYKRAGKIEHVGKLLIGLGIMLFALNWIRQSAQPLQDSEILPLILQSLAKDPVLAVLLAALMTWMAHSSLAIILLLVSFVSSGILPIPVGFYMVLGANLGNAIAPFFATLRDKPAACRVPAGNLIIKAVGVVLAFQFVYPAYTWLLTLDDVPARLIVNYHTAFNLGLALLFLPLTGVISKISARILPDKPDEDDPLHPQYLDYKALDTPTVALASASRETLRMADILENMLEGTITVLKTNDMAQVRRIKEDDNILDALNQSIKLYAAKVSQEALEPKEGLLTVKVLGFSTNLEHAGDIIDKGLMVMAEKKIRNQTNFSEEGMKEIENIHYLVLESVRLAQTVFISGDVKLARQMAEGKERLRQAEETAVANHFERLRDAIPETIATSSLHVDIIRDYRRINTHMCTVAYALLKETGQLRASRLKPLEKES